MKKNLVNTGIALPAAQVKFLKDAALARKHARGGRGRASVSAYLSELIERAMTGDRRVQERSLNPMFAIRDTLRIGA